jgi:hypothetical protein
MSYKRRLSSVLVNAMVHLVLFTITAPSKHDVDTVARAI